MTGVAVKITVVPVQIAPVGVAAMDTLAARVFTTVMVRVFEVAVVPEEQAAFEVTVQVTVLLFASALLVNVALLVPLGTPLTDHT